MAEELKYRDFLYDFKELESQCLKHSHEAYEVYLLIDGELEIHAENRKYQLKRGDVFLLGPRFPHVYIANDRCVKYEINFTAKFLHKYFTSEFARMLIKCYTSEVIHLTDEEIIQFSALFNRMSAEKEQGGTYPLYFANILELLDKASGRQLEEPVLVEFSNKGMAAVTNVVAYINANYRNIRSMDEIADACFISKSYLCHIFKKEYNMTVMDYLKQVRIRYACEFLATSDKTFSLIATKMGFADISHFTKNFKKVKGCTPREYRERKRREQTEQFNQQ